MLILNMKRDRSPSQSPSRSQSRSPSPPPDARGEADDGNWRAVFDSTSNVRQLVEVLVALLPQAELRFERVVDDDGGVVNDILNVEAMDATKTSLVLAKVQCRLASSASACFTLSMSDLSKCMRSIPSHFGIELSSIDDSTDVRLSARDALTNTHTQTYSLATLFVDDPAPSMRMRDQDYDIVVEIEVASFRRIVRNCESFGTSELNLRVQRLAGDADARIVLTIESRGDTVTQTHTFHSSIDETSSASKANVVVPAESVPNTELLDVASLATSFDENFGINALKSFLRPLDKMLVMYMAPERPLILTYALGGDSSFVSLVLAPKVK
jgi:hypothetical protein